MLLTLVAASQIFKEQNNFIAELIEKFPAIKSIVLNINNKATNGVLGSQGKVMYGKGYIEDQLLDMVFQISSGSFHQINFYRQKSFTPRL